MSGISVHDLKEHWQEEGDAVLMYESLAKLEKDNERKQLLLGLADVEREHQKLFASLLEKKKVRLRKFRPSFKAKFLLWLARHGQSQTVFSMLVSEEVSMVKNYLYFGEPGAIDETSKTMRKVARDSVQHAEALMKIAGREGEPWHRIESGGFLRNVVYGFNDGLTANFGLIMGFIGANAHVSFVVLAGLAGAVADALSMGSSGYLAAKSEQEVYEHEIEMEKEEIRLMPDVEKKELELLYRAKGMHAAEAKKAAERVMEDPDAALKEKTSSELGISGQLGSPRREGFITGLATAFGAIIPVFPFFFLSGTAAIAVSFVASMVSHFGIGAARSLFTGRGAIRSGIDMFLVGLGIALIGYYVGNFITRGL